MKLFISYNTGNRLFVKSIADKLRNNGFAIFYDQRDIDAGDKWTIAIQDEIESSDASLIFMGDEGIGKWQNKEAISLINKQLKNDNYRIIPVILPTNNKFINYPLPWFLSDYQWVEFKDLTDENAWDKLVEGLRETEIDIPVESGKNPYKGLQSFEVDDVYCFYGRTSDLNLVFHNKLRFQFSILNHNFLAVVADSGTGKSSFVKAGIMAALKKGKFAGSEHWKQIIFKPGSHPLSALSSNLKVESLIADTRKFEDDARDHPDTLLRTIRDQRDTWVIYIDQFEEVITQCKVEKEREIFLNNIALAVQTEKAIILLSVRSDYYTAFAPYNPFKAVLEANNYTLTNLETINKDEDKSRNLLREIIIKPAKNAGVKIDDNLAETLINDLKHVNGALPILELTLDLLWKNKSAKNEITIKDYAIVANNKNIGGIIEEHSNKVFNNLTNNGVDKRKVELFKRIFVPNLIEINTNGEDVRRTAEKKALLAMPGYQKEEIEEIIQELSGENSRLLTIHETQNGTTIEVVHEVIIREWQLLRGWINDKRDALLYENKIQNDALDYEKGKGELYRYGKLKQARLWKKNNLDLTTNTVNEFISKSRKKVNKSIYLGIAIPLFLIIAVAFSYKPIQIHYLKGDIENNPRLKQEITRQGGINFVTSLTIDQSNYFILADKLWLFSKLDRLSISNLSAFKDLSFLDHNNSIEILTITDNDSLKSLKGLENLSGLYLLEINDNKHLTSLQGIESLTQLSSLKISGGCLNGIEEIRTLKTLSAFTISDDDSLTNLRGIENLTNLSSLRISGNTRLTSLHGMENLKKLHLLEIENNGVTDLRGIENLNSLNSLIISKNNSLTNLRGIENLDSLYSLVISGNNSLTNLQGIGNLKSVRSLEIDNDTNLTSLVRIEDLPNLDSLIISSNTHLAGLHGVENLKNLHLLIIKSNGITNLQWLENLDSLYSLEISGNNHLTSLQGIKNLAGIHLLRIESNDSITSLQEIENLKSLYSLEIEMDIHLKSLQGIKNLPNLYSLYISNNRGLTSLQGIENLPNLYSLYIYGNNSLTSIKGIDNLTHLHSLTISDNAHLVSLQGLANLDSLNSLSISGNDTTLSLTGIENLTALSILTIDNNASLTNLKKIEKLTNLTDLTLRDNANLSSLDGTENLKNLNSLSISSNKSLTSLQGIKNLTGLHELDIYNSNSLKNLLEIANLNSLHLFVISDDFNLKNLKGLENLVGIHTMNISSNLSKSLEGLENITSLDTLSIINNDSLMSLRGMENLKHLHSLTIANNKSLTNLSGIENLSELNELFIYGNDLNNIGAIYKLSTLKKLTIDYKTNIDSTRLKKNNPGIILN